MNGKRSPLASTLGFCEDTFDVNRAYHNGGFKGGKFTDVATALLLVNSQVSQEAIPFLYTQNLCFYGVSVLQEFLKQIGDNV